jgi:site-specific DNA-methyltransferase (adenine-specific)
MMRPPAQGLALNCIYRMNCLEGMQLLPGRSIDMILCDLPYGKTANHWDSVIDLHQLWQAYKRLIRPRGAIVLTAQCPFDKVLGMSNRSWLHYEWIWEKSRATGFQHVHHGPLKAHENVLVFYEHQPRYDPQMEAGMPYVSKGKQRYHRNFRKFIGACVTHNDGCRYPRSVLRIASEGRPFHPTQKPVALFEYLIRTYTNAGDLVLDNCIGSGTTAIACINAGRRFIGFELDKDYHRYAEERVRRRLEELHLS